MTRRYLFLLLGAALLVLLALNWRTIFAAYASLADERRPALVDDAVVGQPESARAFGRRFGRGVAEAELLEWLETNGFSIYSQQHRAERMVIRHPCSENVIVSWSSDAAGRIERAAATVHSAGCF